MSPALPGYVYFDPNFEFLDGTRGKKLFVVLCDSPLDNNNLIVARTTSKPKPITSYGCFLDHPPCFFLPDKINDFDKDTWIMLDYVLEYERSGPERMSRITQLSLQHTIDLLSCGASCHYLAKWQIDAFREELARFTK